MVSDDSASLDEHAWQIPRRRPLTRRVQVIPQALPASRDALGCRVPGNWQATYANSQGARHGSRISAPLAYRRGWGRLSSGHVRGPWSERAGAAGVGCWIDL